MPYLIHANIAELGGLAAGVVGDGIIPSHDEMLMEMNEKCSGGRDSA